MSVKAAQLKRTGTRLTLEPTKAQPRDVEDCPWEEPIPWLLHPQTAHSGFFLLGNSVSYLSGPAGHALPPLCSLQTVTHHLKYEHFYFPTLCFTKDVACKPSPTSCSSGSHFWWYLKLLPSHSRQKKKKNACEYVQENKINACEYIQESSEPDIHMQLHLEIMLPTVKK